MSRSFVDRPQFEILIGLLMLSGAACPKCGYGTRKTSKNWRRCKRETCGERIQMVEPTEANIKNATDALNAGIKECENVLNSPARETGIGNE